MKIDMPFYDIINRFFIGVIFYIVLVAIDSNIYIQINKDIYPNEILTIFYISIFYFLGFILHRMGSIFLEPILKFCGMPWIKYSKFLKNKTLLEKLNILSREYSFSRTTSVMFILLLIITLWNSYYYLSILFFVLLILFILSTVKFAKKIQILLK